MLSIYPACFFKEDNGYSVIFPDLNYLATQGDTLEDAVAMAVDCLAGYLYTAKMDNEKFPKASKLSDINIDRLSDELDEMLFGICLNIYRCIYQYGFSRC